MKKFLSVVKVILIVLLVAVLVGFCVLYLINRELAQEILNTVVDYLNRPLPIVGVSTAVLAVLGWKIFSASSYGQRALNKIKAEYDDQKDKIEEEYNKQKEQISTVIAIFDKEIDIMFDSLIAICKASGNKKIKEIGDVLETNIRAIKEELRNKINEILNTDIDAFIKSKEDIIKSLFEVVEKEMIERYGEEGNKAIESLAEAKTI